MQLPKRIRRFSAQERGAALVEFALVVPLLMAMLCVIIDFGLALYTLNNLTSAVREGARFGAVQQTITADDPAVRDRVISAMTSMTGATIDASKITVAADTVSGVVNVRVTITGYPYDPVTPLAPLFGMGSFSFTRTAVYRWEFQ